MPLVSLIIPTFHEAENAPELLDRVVAVRSRFLPELEMIIVDDSSGDGIERIVAERSLPWVQVIVRRKERGLSGAVVEGFRRSQGAIMVAMDADLSHPPEAIPDLVAAIEAGADFAIGSRYCAGGSTDARWSVLRWLNSRIATAMARPFTTVSDPMSGFFALPRATLQRAMGLNPLGYKIGLELLVKSGCTNVAEIPIHFMERTRGKSKLSIRQQWLYLRHIVRLLRFQHASRRGDG